MLHNCDILYCDTGKTFFRLFVVKRERERKRATVVDKYKEKIIFCVLSMKIVVRDTGTTIPIIIYKLVCDQ